MHPTREYRGKRYSLTQLADMLGVSLSSMHRRVQAADGDMEKAMDPAWWKLLKIKVHKESVASLRAARKIAKERMKRQKEGVIRVAESVNQMAMKMTREVVAERRAKQAEVKLEIAAADRAAVDELTGEDTEGSEYWQLLGRGNQQLEDARLAAIPGPTKYEKKYGLV